jgi:murein DD-endopeptidase MepM/ murein hydrolase activator NlpD
MSLVRSFAFQRLAALAATVLMSSMMLAGCVSDTPRTQLDWYPKSDATVAAVHPRPRPQVAEYTPPRHLAHRKPVQVAALDCPVPTARPDNTKTRHWYSDNSSPSPAPVPSPATYTPAASTGSFAWPLNGTIVADYGATVSGERNDGINIAVPFGTPIRAAAAGEISYAGNELRGYGNLVLIKHDDGYVTAYAHAERIVVARGDTVQKGQIIAYAGQTGDVTSPQLHFEIRKGVAPVNPRTMLASNHTAS